MTSPGEDNTGGRPQPPQPAREDQETREIRLAAERVCALILYSDLPLIDIQIAAAGVRRLCQRHFPDRPHLYRWIYHSRFRRLWQQWRNQGSWD